jgi:predicted HAD superfamily phosphohydrolase YqeG
VEKHLKRLNRAYKPHLRAIKKAIKKMYIPL